MLQKISVQNQSPDAFASDAPLGLQNPETPASPSVPLDHFLPQSFFSFGGLFQLGGMFKREPIEFIREFNVESNPAATRVYLALKAQGIEDEAIDQDATGDGVGKLKASEVFSYVSRNFSSPEVHAALDNAGIPLPEDAAAQVAHGGFAKMMCDYHFAQVNQLRANDGAIKNTAAIIEHMNWMCFYESENAYYQTELAEFYLRNKQHPDFKDNAFALNIPAASAYAAAFHLDPVANGGKLTALVSDSSEEALKLANDLEQAGKLSQAIQVLNQAAQLHEIRNEAGPEFDGNPASVDLRAQRAQIDLRLAKLAARLGDRAAAQQAYQNAIKNCDAWIAAHKNDPGCIAIYRLKAGAQDGMGDYTGAAKSLLKQSNLKKLIIYKLPNEDMSDAIRKTADSRGELDKSGSYGIDDLKFYRQPGDSGWIGLDAPKGNYIPSEAHDIELETPTDSTGNDVQSLDKIPGWARTELSAYQQELANKLNEVRIARQESQAKYPPELRKTSELFASEIALLDTLGRGDEAKQLAAAAEKFRSEAEVSEKTEAAHALTKQGALNYEAVAASPYRRASGMDSQPLSSFVSFAPQPDGSTRLQMSDRFDSLNDQGKAEVLGALLQSAERLQFARRARKAQGPEKSFFEAKIAIVDGDFTLAKTKLSEFKASAGKSTKLKALLQQADALLENLNSESMDSGNSARDLKLLLGSLVPATHRDAKGALKLELLQGIEDFAEFKNWLATQASVDGVVFNQIDSKSALFASHDKLLQNPKYEPLLMTLWAELKKDPHLIPKISAESLANLETDFTREMARMSFKRFVGTHLSSQAGRHKLRAMLKDTIHYDKEFRADLLEEIIDAGEAEGHVPPHVRARFDEQIKTYWDDRLDLSRLTGFAQNGVVQDAVTSDEIAQASRYGLQVLNLADGREQAFSKQDDKYLYSPDEVQMLRVQRGDEWVRPFSPLTMKKMAQLAADESKKNNPASQLKAKLAKLWLSVADNENWTHKRGDYVSPNQRLYMLAKLSAFIERDINNTQDFVALNRELHLFLNGQATPEADESNEHLKVITRHWNQLKGEIQKTSAELEIAGVKIDMEWSIGTTVHDLFEGVDPAAAASYRELRELSDGYWAMEEMQPGSIAVEAPEIKIQDPKLKVKVTELIQGLRDTKRGLWYQYKQQGWLYRGASHLGEARPVLMAIGEDPQIRATIAEANQEIDALIEMLSAASTPEEFEAQVKALTASLNSEGSLHLALKGVDSSGGKELLNIAQIVLEMIATEVVTYGMGSAAALGRAAAVLSKEALAARSLGAGFRAFKALRQAEKLAASGKLLEAGKLYENLYGTAQSSSVRNFAGKNWLQAEMRLAHSENLARIESQLGDLEKLAGMRPQSAQDLSRLIRKHQLNPEDFLEVDNALRTFLSPAKLAKAKSIHGFSTGVKMSLAGNLIGKASGQLRAEPDQISDWFEQALATGFSMAVTGPFERELPLTRKALEKPGVIKAWYREYISAAGLKKGSITLAKKAVHLPSDVFKEVVEEVLDNYALNTMQGSSQMSLDEFRSIVMICASGQGQAESHALMSIGGDIYQRRKGKTASAVTVSAEAKPAPQAGNFPSKAEARNLLRQLKNPLMAAMWMPLGAGSIGGGTDPSGIFNGVAKLLGSMFNGTEPKTEASDKAFSPYRENGIEIISEPERRAALKQWDDRLFAAQTRDPHDPQLHYYWSEIADQLRRAGDMRGEWIALELERAQKTRKDRRDFRLPAFDEEIDQLRDRVTQEIRDSYSFPSEIRLDFEVATGFILRVKPFDLMDPKRLQPFLKTLDRFLSSDSGNLVRSLNLSHNQRMDSASLKAILKLKSLQRLIALDLGYNQLGCGNAIRLANAENLSNLTSLNLDYNNIGDQGVTAIAQSKYLSKLSQLGLQYNRISENAARTLIESNQLPTLRECHLKCNHFTLGTTAELNTSLENKSPTLRIRPTASTMFGAPMLLGLQNYYQDLSHLGSAVQASVNRHAVVSAFASLGTYLDAILQGLPYLAVFASGLLAWKFGGRVLGFNKDRFIHPEKLQPTAANEKESDSNAESETGDHSQRQDQNRPDPSMTRSQSPDVFEKPVYLSSNDGTFKSLDEELLAIQVKNPHDPQIQEHWAIIADYLQQHADPRGKWIAWELELLRDDHSQQEIGDLRSRISNINASIIRNIRDRFNYQGAIELNFDPSIGFTLQVKDGNTNALLSFINSFFVSEFGSLARLLDLSCTQLGDAGSQAIAQSENFPNLTALDLFGNNIGVAGAQAIAQSENFPNLTSLGLGINKIGAAGAQAIAQSENFPHLTALNLHDDEIGAAGAQAIAQSKNFPNLTSLELGYNHIGAAGGQAIAQSEYFPNLTSLELSLNLIGAVGAEAIAQSKNFPNLTSLDLRYNEIGVSGAQVIAQSENFFNLTSLDLGYNEIGEEGSQAIAQSKNFPSLTSLKLGSNKIGAAGAQAIAQSENFQNLTTLNLDGNNIGVAGAQAIAQSENFPNLTTLNLDCNNIGVAGAQAIAQSEHFPNLTSLSLHDGEIGVAEKQAIIDHLPNLIEFNAKKIQRPKSPAEINEPSPDSHMMLAAPALFGLETFFQGHVSSGSAITPLAAMLLSLSAILIQRPWIHDAVKWVETFFSSHSVRKNPALTREEARSGLSLLRNPLLAPLWTAMGTDGAGPLTDSSDLDEDDVPTLVFSKPRPTAIESRIISNPELDKLDQELRDAQSKGQEGDVWAVAADCFEANGDPRGKLISLTMARQSLAREYDALFSIMEIDSELTQIQRNIHEILQRRFPGVNSFLEFAPGIGFSLRITSLNEAPETSLVESLSEIFSSEFGLFLRGVTINPDMAPMPRKDIWWNRTNGFIAKCVDQGWFRKISHLSLKDIRIDVSEIAKLGSTQNNLAHLKLLGGNAFDDWSVAVLAEATSLQQLTDLRISYITQPINYCRIGIFNYIHPDSIQGLINSPHFSNLVTFNGEIIKSDDFLPRLRSATRLGGLAALQEMLEEATQE